MAPPPATPAQPRFLLSKRLVTQGEKHTPAQPHNGPQQFSSTPRFSVSSTPRQPANQPLPFSTPAPSITKYRQLRSHATSDIIDSSPQSSELVQEEEEEEEDAHGFPESIEIDPLDASSSLQSQSGERSPKRRRISPSPGFDISSQPALEDDDGLGVGLEDELGKSSGGGSENAADSPLNSQYSFEGEATPVPDPASRPQPNFQRAPRFKTTEVLQGEQHHQLPEAFSPQRRGAKYVPGGLAAEVRDWLVQIKGSTDYDRPGGLKVRLVVEEVKSAEGLWLITGRRVRDDRLDESSPTVQAILAGKGRITGLDSPSAVIAGSVVDIAQPAWDVLLQHQDRWAVACDWEVVENQARTRQST